MVVTDVFSVGSDAMVISIRRLSITTTGTVVGRPAAATAVTSYATIG